jgi:hypothetical protein
MQPRWRRIRPASDYGRTGWRVSTRDDSLAMDKSANSSRGLVLWGPVVIAVANVDANLGSDRRPRPDLLRGASLVESTAGTGRGSTRPRAVRCGVACRCTGKAPARSYHRPAPLPMKRYPQGSRDAGVPSWGISAHGVRRRAWSSFDASSCPGLGHPPKGPNLTPTR